GGGAGARVPGRLWVGGVGVRGELLRGAGRGRRVPAFPPPLRVPWLAGARRSALGRSRQDRRVAAPGEPSADRGLRHDMEMDQSDGAGMVRDPYEVLGVSPDASPEEIRDAYWRLVRFHREEGDAAWMPTHLGEIQDAYEVLSDPTRRAESDTANGAHQPPAPAPYRPGYPPHESGLLRPSESGAPYEPGAPPPFTPSVPVEPPRRSRNPIDRLTHRL